MQIRDKFLDKTTYQIQETIEANQLMDKANQFFSTLPNVEIEAEKKQCPICKRQHKLYCLKCSQLLLDKEILPQIELPINITIAHHHKEKHQKSSALPIQFLSNQVKVIDYSGGPLIFEDNTIVLYPHKDAKFMKELSEEELNRISQVVAIDCTWHQTNEIIDQISQNNQNIQFVKLQDYETFFWRYQHHSLKCLATVEAIYYFYKELNEIKGKDQQNLECLLYFYKYSFQQIQKECNNIYSKIDDKKKRRLEQKQLAKQSKFIKQI